MTSPQQRTCDFGMRLQLKTRHHKFHFLHAMGFFAAFVVMRFKHRNHHHIPHVYFLKWILCVRISNTPWLWRWRALAPMCCDGRNKEHPTIVCRKSVGALDYSTQSCCDTMRVLVGDCHADAMCLCVCLYALGDAKRMARWSLD